MYIVTAVDLQKESVQCLHYFLKLALKFLEVLLQFSHRFFIFYTVGLGGPSAPAILALVERELLLVERIRNEAQHGWRGDGGFFLRIRHKNLIFSALRNLKPC